MSIVVFAEVSLSFLPWNRRRYSKSWYCNLISFKQQFYHTFPCYCLPADLLSIRVVYAKDMGFYQSCIGRQVPKILWL